MEKDKTNKRHLLTVKQVSKELGIPLSTIYRLTNNGSLKSIRIGGRWYYREDEIEKYLSCDGVKIHRRCREEAVERREYPRLNCRIECEYTINLPNKRDTYNGVIRNISAGGVLLRAKGNIDGINSDDPITLRFKLDEEEEKGTVIKTKGRVVRKAEDDSGVKFRNINKEYQESVIKFIG